MSAATAAAQLQQPEPASGFAPKPAAHAQRFMAATANRHATDAAIEVLRAGGSAVDAAIAAQFVLNLVEPQSSGIGGGGFMLVYDARARRLRAYDGRETAPAAARPDRFLDAQGRPLSFHAAAIGGRAVGVPGLAALLAHAHARHGKLPWRRLLRPAIRLAEQGFVVSPRLHALLAQERFLRENPEAAALYYRAGGSPVAVGERLRNPRLAATLRELARHGARRFYTGPIAAAVARAVAADPRSRGDIERADLARYRVAERDPLCGRYRLYLICGMGPPSSGGVAVLQMLAILERFPLPQHPPLSAPSVHWFAEAGRLAFADRAQYLADPGYFAVPLEGLLSRRYLARRSASIRDDASLGRASPGAPEGAPLAARGDGTERPGTTHLSIVDARGNAVALTSSIEDAFGARLMVRGFLLNNQLTDFAFTPEREGRPVANRVQPGKRPLSSMAPTMVFDRSGRLEAVLGSPGGSQIINYVAQTLVALLDWSLPAAEAIAQPHFGSRNGPTELEAGTAAAGLRAELERRGHEVQARDMTSGLHLVVRAVSGWIGAADPRREGSAAGD